MRKILIVFLFLAVCSTARGQTPNNNNPAQLDIAGTSTAFTTSSAAWAQVGSNNGAFGVGVAGTWTGTLSFFGSIGNQPLVAINATPSNSTTAVTTTTANGAWTVNVAGYNVIYVVFTTYGSGVAQVTITPSNGITASSGGGGGGAGVSSLNTLTGAVTLAAGTNISLTPSGNTITIAGTGGAVTGCTTTGGVGFENGTSNTLTCSTQAVIGQATGNLSTNTLCLGTLNDCIYSDTTPTDGVLALQGTASAGNNGSISFLTGALNPLQLINTAGVGIAEFGVPVAANLFENFVSSTATTYQGGNDAASLGVLGQGIFRGGDQTGTGGAFSGGGSALIRGGNNAATNAGSEAGSVEIAPGMSNGATQGQQGLLILSDFYVKGGGTSTQWNLQCIVGTTAMTVNDCGATPPLIQGVAAQVNANTVLTHTLSSQTPVNASAAVTVGDTVCAGATAGVVTDSGGTGQCTTGITVGNVLAVSGTYFLPITGSVTLSTTLPLIQIQRTQATASTGASQVFNTQSSAVTTNIAATSMVASTGAMHDYLFTWTISLTVVGVACTGNTTVTLNDIFTDPNSSTPTTQALGTVTLASQGVGTLGFIASGTSNILAKTGTAVQYSTTSYTPGVACTTNPTYQVSPTLVQLW
jgi:hypothetical protein